MSVSVVIPYFNSKHTILTALRSINNQTIRPLEVIVVDDKSEQSLSANFLEIQASEFDFNLILIYHDRNRGASAARNSGILKAQGHYIAFLDSDDAWVENKLELQLLELKKRKFDYLYSLYSEFLPNENIIKPKSFKVTFQDILKKNLSPVTLIAKRSNIILFDERLRRCDDFKLSIEAILLGNRIGMLNFYSSYGFKKSIGESGLTGSLLKMSLSFIFANILLQLRYPKFILWGIVFILFEILKFPVRVLRIKVFK
jgi:glycosyltransferase involved in cell wall biosynthesis